MKKLLLSAVLALSLPASAFAATYQYVTTTGQLSSVNADTADQALLIAPNIAPHSGVMLVSGSLPVVTTGTPSAYEYVSTAGTLMTVNATTPAQAFASATNIAPHSGVMAIY